MFEKRKAEKQGSPGAQNNPVIQSEPVSSSKSTMGTPGGRAVIGSGIKIDGDITGTENLVIKGKVAGKVNLPANEVEVENSAVVTADISANVIKIAGNVQGDLTGKEKVIILKTGNVKGNITAPRVTLEDGAKFKGSIDMDPSDTAVELPLKASLKAENVKPVASHAAPKEASLGLKAR
ncbi:MAG: polymer-forming cytoskeletal protein [Xanthomonadales bacterium]|nr:polymer-forming cytoskeletal protein [Xanthomonadales bacterium]